MLQVPQKWQILCEAFVSLSIVLPPTVLGFYLLMILGADSPLGPLVTSFNDGAGLIFTFEGLVVGSCFYSLPFVFQPIMNAYLAIPNQAFKLAATLGLNPFQRFYRVGIPLAWKGIVTGGILGFAHTMGEFGVVLMIGGNIPGETRVVSVAIYDYVETLDYASAHRLSLILLGISFVCLFAVGMLNRKRRSSSHAFY